MSLSVWSITDTSGKEVTVLANDASSAITAYNAYCEEKVKGLGSMAVEATERLRLTKVEQVVKVDINASE